MIDDRLTRLQKMAQRFSENGSVDQITMRKIDEIRISAAQKAELDSRYADYQAGKLETFDAENILAELRNKLQNPANKP